MDSLRIKEKMLRELDGTKSAPQESALFLFGDEPRRLLTIPSEVEGQTGEPNGLFMRNWQIGGEG
jgi:hypothetical protein